MSVYRNSKREGQTITKKLDFGDYNTIVTGLK
jgi:hypothetical protein